MTLKIKTAPKFKITSKVDGTKKVKTTSEMKTTSKVKMTYIMKTTSNIGPPLQKVFSAHRDSHTTTDVKLELSTDSFVNKLLSSNVLN